MPVFLSESGLAGLLAATILKNPWIPHEPTGRQAEFLLLPHKEAFYGGAAGGGKSDALLMAALQYVDVSNYSALLLRRTHRELALPGALMDRAQDWLASTEARFEGESKTWHFPSGATVTFGYLDIDNDRYRYQSSHFQFIGFDELTQFTEVQYLYLFSRLRRLEGSVVPLRMRSASNPDGVGYEWVKSRFVNPGDLRRPFVSARLEDNPHLDRISYVDSLNELDSITRERLLRGDWEIQPRGVLFQKEHFRYFQQQGSVYELFKPGGIERIPADICIRFSTMDLAASVKNSADYTVYATWAVTPKMDLLLLDVIRVRMEGADHRSLVMSGYSKWRPQIIGIEKAFSGLTLIQEMVRQGLPIIGLDADKDKYTRALPASARMSQGTIYLLAGADWLPDWELEHLRFTGKSSDHDDQVDCTAYAARFLATLYVDTQAAEMGEDGNTFEGSISPV